MRSQLERRNGNSNGIPIPSRSLPCGSPNLVTTLTNTISHEYTHYKVIGSTDSGGYDDNYVSYAVGCLTEQQVFPGRSNDYPILRLLQTLAGIRFLQILNRDRLEDGCLSLRLAWVCDEKKFGAEFTAAPEVLLGASDSRELTLRVSTR
ncbi:hypothetical protein HDF16_002185 [Granulicella aggregans]|uniref:Uncharacterized protein n=1 Tax=Granulicella aggregans TaxID=474949 RepID=A0A7W7ZDB0_9BACT|nr:hypothetical protein [Granulicella aggregans]MBB5057479.1 hypothetical protein [Granulicella aggregans]